MSKIYDGLTKEEITQLKKIYWRSNPYCPLFSFDRQCAVGLQWGLYPFINWLYPNPEDKEKKIAALKRHSVFFNITPYIVTIGMGIFASMEKKAAEDDSFDANSINAIKAAIQGPLAGIGDAIYWVAWRVIVTSIALPFALNGSALGGVLFLLLFNLPHYIGKYYLTFASYKAGTKIIESAFENGIIDVIVKAASIMGMTMIGAMACSLCSIPLIASLTVEGGTISILEMFDGIMPGILTLGFLLLLVWLIRNKRANVILLTAIIFAVGILGALVGIF